MKKIEDFCLALSCICLLILAIIKLCSHYNVSVESQFLEFLIDIINVYLVYRIVSSNSISLRYLKWAIYVILIMDTFYYIVYSTPRLFSLVYDFDLLHFLYFFLIISYLFRILRKYVLTKNELVIILCLLFVIDIFILINFSIALNINNVTITIRYIIQFTQSSIDLVIFNLAFLWLLCSKDTGTSLLSGGILLLTSSETLLTSCYISNLTSFLDIGELLWLAGLISISFSLKYFTDSEVKSWKVYFCPLSSINSSLTLWTFSIAFVSFLLLFWMIHLFTVINEKFYVFFPSTLMLYSLGIIIISRLVGRYFELQFIKITENFNNQLSGVPFTRHNFYINEYQTFDKKSSDIIEFKQRNIQLIQLFSELSANVAHNLASPLKTAIIATSLIKNLSTQTKEIQTLEKSLIKIKSNVNNLLIKYRGLETRTKGIDSNQEIEDLSETPEILLINNLIENVIIEKKIEWLGSSCEIIYDNFTKGICWISCSKIQFNSLFSNILNNAYESMTDFKKINIKVDNHSKSEIIIQVSDSGIGISQSDIAKFLSGKSNKHTGRGFGLSSANDYLKSIGSELQVKSIPTTKGTTISFKLPISHAPEWFQRVIYFSKQSVLLIIEDDLDYYESLSQKLNELKITYVHFRTSEEFFSWKEVTDFKSCATNLILFIDYNLVGSIFNGLEIIQEIKEEVKNTNIFLVTNAYDDDTVQFQANKHNFKIIPKCLLVDLAFTYLSEKQNMEYA